MLDLRVDLEFGLLWFFDADATQSVVPRLTPPTTFALLGSIGVVAAQHLVDGPVHVIAQLSAGRLAISEQVTLGEGVISLRSGKMAVNGDATVEPAGVITVPAGTYRVRVSANSLVDPEEIEILLSPAEDT